MKLGHELLFRTHCNALGASQTLIRKPLETLFYTKQHHKDGMKMFEDMIVTNYQFLVGNQTGNTQTVLTQIYTNQDPSNSNKC